MRGIAFAGHLHGRFSSGKSESFTGIEFAEVDGLGNVGIGFGPVLADFENQPGHVIHFALAQPVGGAEQQARRALRRGCGSRSTKAFSAAFIAGLYVLFPRFLMNANDLRRARGVQGLDLVCSLDALAADDEVILAAELSAHCSMAARILRALSSWRKS